MSYILEALKKSQQERELGHVPRLQNVAYDERLELAQPHRWIYLAVLLALIAVAVALYAVLRRDVPFTGEPSAVSADSMQPGHAGIIRGTDAGQAVVGEPAPSARVPVEPGPRLETVAGPASAAEPKPMPEPPPDAFPRPAVPRNSVEPPAPRLAAREPEPAVAAISAPSPRPAETAKVSDSSDDPDTEPQVLVVPAPPKPGAPMPRGAEELRRAVLGDAATSAPAPRSDRAAPALEETTPIPEDLIADIEAFKQQVGAVTPPTSPPAVPRPPDLIGATAAPSGPLDGEVPPRASVALRQKLPDFKMAVHVYDVDPSRRFVYINGRKLSERQKSREGLRVEEVLADGAVLSWQGERFFQPR